MNEKNISCVLVAMFDKVTGQYSTPMAFDSIAVAKRWFTFYIKKADLMAEPSDFELYYIGNYFAEFGIIETWEKKEFLMKGVATDE